MAKFEIEGREFELEGIDSDAVVIARPCELLTFEQMLDFSRTIHHIAPAFKAHRITLISANKDQVTFEVIRAKQELPNG